ncbi:MAG TPA: TraR/DksA C4-type zinc finger protein [Acidimicrobiales bacterium]|nr:TraR/DksA C4-type zinc finger protein [Acidimicrobiales bacterium]
MATDDPSTGARHREALRARLSRVTALRADLEAELEAIGESTASVPDDEHDPEGSTVGYERARVTALLASARQEIEGLRAGLARAAADTYGRCQECGRAIGYERLLALPSATRCVSCAAQTPSHRPTGASPNR